LALFLLHKNGFFSLYREQVKRAIIINNHRGVWHFGPINDRTVVKAYSKNRQSFDTRKIKHIHARNNEWVCVHRTHPASRPAASSTDWLWPLVAKIGGAIIIFVIICKIITALLPLLVLAAIGWLFLLSRR
jgi:hypothetical protein